MMHMMRFLMLIAFLATGLATAAAAFDPQNLSAEGRAALHAEIRSYLLENPEVLIEVSEVLEQRRRASQEQQDADLIRDNAGAIYNDGASHVGGNPDGDVTLVEFIDYRCGYCRRAHPEIAELIASDGNIRLIVKEFPILGEQSDLSAKFAIAVRQVAGRKAYEGIGDELMAFRGQVTTDSLRGLAEGHGLDAGAVIERMDSGEVAAEIAANRALAQVLGINGTPAFVLGDAMIRGYLPLDAMRELVSAARDG